MTRRGWMWVAALAVLASCAHAKKEEARAEAPAPTVAAPPVAPAPPAVASVAPAMTCDRDEACGAAQLCISSRCVDITAGLAECKVASAHFDFDRSVLHESDFPMLRRAARCLSALPTESALIEGNCDERGTVEYNIALGYRRAASVVSYLENLGVASGRLSTVSYGKEIPVCTQSNEACWAQNRRADVAPGAEPKDVAGLIKADEAKERRAPAERTKAPPGAAEARRPASPMRPATPREQPATTKQGQ